SRRFNLDCLGGAYRRIAAQLWPYAFAAVSSRPAGHRRRRTTYTCEDPGAVEAETPMDQRAGAALDHRHGAPAARKPGIGADRGTPGRRAYRTGGTPQVWPQPQGAASCNAADSSRRWTVPRFSLSVEGGPV